MKRLLVALTLGLGLTVLVAYGLRAAPTYAATDAQVIVGITTVAPVVIDTGPGINAQSIMAAIDAGPPIALTAIDISPPAGEPSLANYYSGNGFVDTFDTNDATASARAPDQPDHPAVNVTAEQAAKKA